ncbi:MAG: hypothetical protein LBJ57_06395 [Prevotellaceae bacterium]|jgi:hypothetical protein|nr:hypothetical protein [Prevotellaceae bacterium]
MKTNGEWGLKKGDVVHHKQFGACEVVDFVNWPKSSPDPILRPTTEDGKKLLAAMSGVSDMEELVEVNKRMLEDPAAGEKSSSAEKDIQKFIEYETREQKISFWGSDCAVKPQLISEVDGDGLQIAWLTPIDTRPRYYVLRIDSSHDVNSDDFDYELLLQMVESEFGSANDYVEVEVNGEEFYVHINDADFEGNLVTPPEEVRRYEYIDFPVLCWSGGSYGSYGCFKGVSYCRILRKLLSTMLQCRAAHQRESLDCALKFRLEAPEAVCYTVMSKIQEANGIDFGEYGEYGDYSYWEVDRKDYPSDEAFYRAWYKPRLKAIRKAVEFLKQKSE